MPQKLYWSDRYLFVGPNGANARPCYPMLCKRITNYERALTRCSKAKSFTNVLGRLLTKEEISSALRNYVRDNDLSYNDIARKNSSFQSWSRFVHSGALPESVTIYFCSRELPLRVFHEFAARRKVAKLAQAVTEEVPYPIGVPWDNFDVCFFGTDVWRIDATEKAIDVADLRLLILDKVDRERRKFETLRRRFSGAAGRTLDPRRQPIPESVRMYVWRGRGKVRRLWESRTIRVRSHRPRLQGREQYGTKHSIALRAVQ